MLNIQVSTCRNMAGAFILSSKLRCIRTMAGCLPSKLHAQETGSEFPYVSSISAQRLEAIGIVTNLCSSVKDYRLVGACRCTSDATLGSCLTFRSLDCLVNKIYLKALSAVWLHGDFSTSPVHCEYHQHPEISQRATTVAYSTQLL